VTPPLPVALSIPADAEKPLASSPLAVELHIDGL